VSAGTISKPGSGVIRYEPGDQTIAVEAGMTLAALSRLLDERDQFLPNQCWLARGEAGESVTVGDLVAAAADGCLDLGYGRVRDRILGVKVALADGTVAKGRGGVVKNVAGYDVPRLMTGSNGTLGVILEASFKLQPKPRDEKSALFHFKAEADAFSAARIVRETSCEPVFLDVLVAKRRENSDRGADLAIGFDGTAARVDGQVESATRAIGAKLSADRRVLEGPGNAALRTRLDDAASLDGCASPSGAIVRISALSTLIASLTTRARDAAIAEGCAASIDARTALGLSFLTIFAPSDDDLARAVRAALARIEEGAQWDAREARKERRPLPASVHAAVRSMKTASPGGVRSAGGSVPGDESGTARHPVARELSLRLKNALDPDNVFPGESWNRETPPMARDIRTPR
jgi:FAD/FMN-containing dehydrogenase